MARAPARNRKTNWSIGSAEARDKLPTRAEPYWVSVTPGTALGYYKGARDRCWYVRQRVGSRYTKQRIGTADDLVKADGEIVLSHREAVTKATTVQLEKRQAPAPRHYSDGTTLNDVFEAYIEDRQITPDDKTKRVMGATSAKATRQVWGRHVKGTIGAKLVTSLGVSALRLWHRGVAAAPPTVRGKAQEFDKTDPAQLRSRRASANRVLTMVKAALTWARKNDRLPDDMPDWWRNVSPYGLGDDPTPRMLDQDEITRMLNAAPADLRTLLTGALMTGCRYGELATMKVGNYFADHGTVKIYQSKTGKEFMQPLTDEGIALFDRLTVGRGKAELMFTRADGSPWAKGSAIRPMRELVAAAKLDDVSFKTTRATYGKLLLIATKDIELVAKALGHSDSRITRVHYAAMLPSEVAAGIAKLPALGIDTESNVSALRQPARSA